MNRTVISHIVVTFYSMSRSIFRPSSATSSASFRPRASICDFFRPSSASSASFHLSAANCAFFVRDFELCQSSSAVLNSANLRKGDTRCAIFHTGHRNMRYLLANEIFSYLGKILLKLL